MAEQQWEETHTSRYTHTCTLSGTLGTSLGFGVLLFDLAEPCSFIGVIKTLIKTRIPGMPAGSQLPSTFFLHKMVSLSSH